MPFPAHQSWFLTYPKVQSWRQTLFHIKNELPEAEYIVLGKELYKNPTKGHTKHIHVYIRFLTPLALDFRGPVSTVAGCHGNYKPVTHDEHIVLCYVTKSKKVIGHHCCGEEAWTELRRAIAHWREQYRCKQLGQPVHITGDAYSSPQDRLPESPLAPKLAPSRNVKARKAYDHRLSAAGIFNPPNTSDK